MDATEFQNKVARLHHSQSATLRFKQDGVSALQRLWGARDHSALTFEDHHELVVMAVVQSGDWGDDQNRTVTVWNLSSVDEDLLALIARDIEFIGVADHLAKACASSRVKFRERAIVDFQDKVLEAGIKAEAAEWGFDIEASVVEEDGLPIILFHIVHNSTVLHTIAVDTWTGNVFKGWTEGCKAKYVSPDFHVGAHDLNGKIFIGLSQAIEAAAEKLTAA